MLDNRISSCPRCGEEVYETGFDTGLMSYEYHCDECDYSWMEDAHDE